MYSMYLCGWTFPTILKEERDQVDESGNPVLVPLNTMAYAMDSYKEFASLMLLYASMYALEPSTEQTWPGPPLHQCGG